MFFIWLSWPWSATRQNIKEARPDIVALASKETTFKPDYGLLSIPANKKRKTEKTQSTVSNAGGKCMGKIMLGSAHPTYFASKYAMTVFIMNRFHS